MDGGIGGRLHAARAITVCLDAHFNALRPYAWRVLKGLVGVDTGVLEQNPYGSPGQAKTTAFVHICILQLEKCNSL